jgi:thiamine biosynthesis lipoprotein
MGTIVSIQVVDAGAREAGAAIDRAFAWFRHVEDTCSRFDPRSELRQLSTRPGEPVPVSDLLFRAVEFAVAVAEETDGAFDPTIGGRLEARGFNRNYRTGEIVTATDGPGAPASYRDIALDSAATTITLARPLVLDLGAVAKGLAIDMAARELAPFEHYAIDAGGDLYLAGRNPAGERWAVGLRHPRRDREFFDVVRVSNVAVCTSGDYERPAVDGTGHHILDPRNGASADVVVSATVIAPTALLADALATAAFVLGPTEGLALLEQHGVDGLIVSPTLDRVATPGMVRDYELGRRADSSILPDA